MASLLGGAHYEHGGTFSSGNSTESTVIVELLSKSGAPLLENGVVGLVAQNITASVSKQDREVFEIGTNYYYRIVGRTSGNGSIQHLVGPNTKKCLAGLNAWAGCDPVTLSIEARPTNTDCPGGAGTVVGDGPLFFTGGHLNSVQLSVTAGEVMVTSNLGFTFMDLSNSMF